MSNLVDMVNKEQARDLGVKFKAGDTIKVHYKVKEGEKERIQVFEGLVIAIKTSTFTVRKISSNVGVERVLPKASPLIDKIEIVKVGQVRRAKLYYIRDKVGKAAKIKEAKREYKKN